MSGNDARIQAERGADREGQPLIRRAEASDAGALGALAALLWPETAASAHEEAFKALLPSEEAACFLACCGGVCAGFAQCQLRHDYVEGTKTSPVGYLEGIYVLPEQRGRGLAAALLARCEAWASARGCAEFASDCELTNLNSLRFHLALGFEEANRIICFRKPLPEPGEGAEA